MPDTRELTRSFFFFFFQRAVAWSNKVEAKERKVERKLKKDRKKEFLKRQRDEPEGGKDDDDDVDDWDDLAAEERLAKKVRKGKMSQRDFDAVTSSGFDDL